MTMTAPLEVTPTALHNPSATRPASLGDADPGVSINVVLAALLGLAIVAALVGFGSDAAANDPLSPASDRSEVVDSIEIYVVQPGDTLWSIATAVSVEGEDVRPLVDHLKEVAGGSALDVGQRIVIDHALMRS